MTPLNSRYFDTAQLAAREIHSDAVTAVRAAISLRSRFGEILTHWLPKWNLYTAQRIEVGLGCGIHTGKVLVGNVGTDFRDQFTALGPDVNLAARIEARAEQGQILLSQSTQARVKSLIGAIQIGVIDNIKNIPGEFNLFEVRQ